MARFTILLAALIALLVVRPFIEGLAPARVLSTLLFSAALLSALYGVAQPRWAFRLGIVLAVPALAATWLPDAAGGAGLQIARNSLLMLAFAFTAVVMVLHTSSWRCSSPSSSGFRSLEPARSRDRAGTDRRFSR